MSFFLKKQEIGLEEFCRDFYNNYILNPVIGELNVGTAFSEVITKEASEADPMFASVDKQKLSEELIVIRFELFALAWAHKFISGKNVIAQSVFTKNYLHKKGREDIWNGMQKYNEIIDGVTLHWLTGLGKINLSFNYNTRKELAIKNIEEAKKMEVSLDESIEMINNRLLSENAWKQKLLLGSLVFTFCDRIGINAEQLKEGAQFRLAVIIRGLYEGAQQSLKKVKIKN